MLKQILPKIKDAGKRAGLVKYFAPKIEEAMSTVERKIQSGKHKKEALIGTDDKPQKKQLKK